MDLADVADHGITTINVRNGGEFYDVLGVDRLTQHSKLYVCQDRRYLATFSQPKPSLYLNGKKREFPTYLLVNNIVDLKRTVHFEITWSDNVSMQLKNNVGQFIFLEFNIYEEDEDE
jgi:hypothetical protein